jgi:predicted permease
MRWSRFARDRDFDQEVETHLTMLAERFLRQGMTPEEARQAARRQFGNTTLLKEARNDMNSFASLETLWQDIRYALRMIRRSPGFTAVTVLSLALGIGANTAVFSLINTLMLRLLPVREPDQLVELLQHYPGEPRGNGYWSVPSYQYYRDHNHIFSGLIATSTRTGIHLRAEGLEVETVNGVAVTGNFFAVLGVDPAIGRLIGPADEPAGGAAPTVAMVSWSWWKNRFNLNPAILGKQILVQDAPVTIVGVAPAGFTGLTTGTTTDIWMPLPTNGQAGVSLIGRMKPGVSIEQVRAEMGVLFRFTIEERTRNNKDSLIRQLKVEVEPAGAGLSLLRDHFAKPLILLMAVVALVLLIACTNVAGLLLARGASRKKEMALRVAMGAGRLRLVRQALTESMLLAGAGSLFGMGLAYFGAGALVRLMTSGRPIIGLPQPLVIPLRPDGHVLLFTAGVALLTGLLFGLAPAWNAWSSTPAFSLRVMGGSGETRFRRRFGQSLVIAQVGLSVVLLSTAGLFVRHLSNLRHLDLGFRRDHVLLVKLDNSRGGYSPEALSRAYQELLARMEGIPGVRSASLSAPTPLSGAGAADFATVEGYQERPEDRRYLTISYVAPKYFETMGVPLVAGRDFNLPDQRNPRIAIISQSMARYYFPGGNPIGKHVTLEHVTGVSGARTYEIVGVAGDAHYYEIREPAARTVYLPAFQDGRVMARDFMLRTSLPPESEAGAVQSAVREVLKTIPVARFTTLADQVDGTIVPERLIATLSGLFGSLGSLLAALGLYGLLAYTVARRTTEFGIRLALAATPRNLVAMVIVDALALVVAGLLIGGPVAFWSKKFAASLIQDVQITTVAPLALGAVATVGIALLAAIFPARRASRVDPIRALRYE